MSLSVYICEVLLFHHVYRLRMTRFTICCIDIACKFVPMCIRVCMYACADVCQACECIYACHACPACHASPMYAPARACARSTCTHAYTCISCHQIIINRYMGHCNVRFRLNIRMYAHTRPYCSIG
jgi:hypothetical protein